MFFIEFVYTCMLISINTLSLSITVLPKAYWVCEQADNELWSDEDSFHPGLLGRTISTNHSCWLRHPTLLLTTKLNVLNIMGCSHGRGKHGLRSGYASSLLSATSLLFIIRSMLVMIWWRDHVFFGRWSHNLPLARTWLVCKGDELVGGGVY
jgi:hypothetical protein